MTFVDSDPTANEYNSTASVSTYSQRSMKGAAEVNGESNTVVNYVGAE